jgi:hypothetical protein
MYPVERLLKWFLVVVALHTFAVGVVLLSAGNGVMEFFGFPPLESRFFQMQGGVFHLLVPYVYYKASRAPERYIYLIGFSVVMKLTAAVFLFSYFFFIESIVIVLLSGIIDLGMGMIIALLYVRLKRTKRKTA